MPRTDCQSNSQILKFRSKLWPNTGIQNNHSFLILLSARSDIDAYVARRYAPTVIVSGELGKRAIALNCPLTIPSVLQGLGMRTLDVYLSTNHAIPRRCYPELRRD